MFDFAAPLSPPFFAFFCIVSHFFISLVQIENHETKFKQAHKHQETENYLWLVIHV
jgi:hypothetical protein